MQGTSVGVVSDTEVMAQLTANHQTVMSILSSRQATLQVVKGFWVHGDAGGALSAILQAAGMHSASDTRGTSYNHAHIPRWWLLRACVDEAIMNDGIVISQCLCPFLKRVHHWDSVSWLLQWLCAFGSVACETTACCMWPYYQLGLKHDYNTYMRVVLQMHLLLWTYCVLSETAHSCSS